MAENSTSAIDCYALYGGNPDIDGLGTFVAFVSHTCIFLLLTLVITPLLEFYIPRGVTWSELGRIQGFGLAPLLYRRLQISSLHYNPAARAGPNRTGLFNNEAPHPDTDLKYTSACRECMDHVYIAQHIVGISYVVAGLIKWRTMSPYHMRLLGALYVMNLSISLSVMFERHRSIMGILKSIGRHRIFKNLRSAADRRDNGASNQRLSHEPLGVAELAHLFGWMFLAAIASLFSRLRTQDYATCSSGVLRFMAVEFCVVSFLPWVFLEIRTPTSCDRSPLRRIGFLLLTAGLVSYEAVVFQKTKRIFRSPEDAKSSVADQFSFGQLLILAMVIPLLVDYAAAFRTDLKVIYIIHRQQGDEPQWTTLFTVLVPMFATNMLRPLEPFFRPIHRRLFSRGKQSPEWPKRSKEKEQAFYSDTEGLRPSIADRGLLSPSPAHSQHSREQPTGLERRGAPSSRRSEDPDAILPAPSPTAWR